MDCRRLGWILGWKIWRGNGIQQEFHVDRGNWWPAAMDLQRVVRLVTEHALRTAGPGRPQGKQHRFFSQSPLESLSHWPYTVLCLHDMARALAPTDRHLLLHLCSKTSSHQCNTSFIQQTDSSSQAPAAAHEGSQMNRTQSCSSREGGAAAVAQTNTSSTVCRRLGGSGS